MKIGPAIPVGPPGPTSTPLAAECMYDPRIGLIPPVCLVLIRSNQFYGVFEWCNGFDVGMNQVLVEIVRHDVRIICNICTYFSFYSEESNWYEHCRVYVCRF